MTDHFRRFAHATARAVGSVRAFFLALLVIVVWAATGPIFGFSNTWQLVINSCTTIVTFLMVFLIQATQNRDSREIHLKLDELLRSISKARTGIADLEDLSDEELDSLLQEFHHARRKKGMTELVEKKRTRRGRDDDGEADLDGDEAAPDGDVDEDEAS